MTEAWLLIDADAIKRAARNPGSRIRLRLPPTDRLEALADPKTLLHDLLRLASERRGRRAKTFDLRRAVSDLAEEIQDHSVLLALPAFATVLETIRRLPRG